MVRKVIDMFFDDPNTVKQMDPPIFGRWCSISSSVSARPASVAHSKSYVVCVSLLL